MLIYIFAFIICYIKASLDKTVDQEMPKEKLELRQDMELSDLVANYITQEGKS